MFSSIKLNLARSVFLSAAVFLCSEECLAGVSQKSNNKKYYSVASPKKKKNFFRNKATLNNPFSGFMLSFGLAKSKSKVTFEHAAETASVLADVRAKDNYLEPLDGDENLVSEPYAEFFVESDRWKSLMRVDMTAAKCKHIYDSQEELLDKTVSDVFAFQSCNVKIEPHDFWARFAAGEDILYDKKSEVHAYLRNPDAEYRKKSNTIFRRNFYNFQDWLSVWKDKDGKQEILEKEKPYLRESEKFLYLMPLVKKNGLRTFGFSQKLDKCGGTFALNYRKGFKKSHFLFGWGIDLCFVPKSVRVEDNTDYTDLGTTKIMRLYEPVKVKANSVRKIEYSDIFKILANKSDICAIVKDPNGSGDLLGLVYPSTFGNGNVGRLVFLRGQDGNIAYSDDNFYFLNCLAFAEFYSEKIYDIIKSKEAMTNENGRFLEPGKTSDYYAEFMNKLAINEDTGKLMYYDFQTKRNSVIPSFDITFGREFLDDKLLFEVFLGVSYVQAKTFFKAKTMLARYSFPESPHLFRENIHKIAPSFGFNVCYRISNRVNCFYKLRYIGKVNGTKAKLGRTTIWSVGLGFRF